MNDKTDLTKEYAILSTKVSMSLDGLQVAIREINDNNVLHRQALEKNTQAIVDIKGHWAKLLWVVVVALIVLAGAEKAITLIGS